MSDHDVEALLQFAVRHTARKIKLQDTDWKTPKELLNEIAAVDASTHKLLSSFCEAYREWYGFVNHLDQLGKRGNLNHAERRKLVDLTQKRDSTRSSVLAHLKSLS